MTGRTPLSPLRIRAAQALSHSRKDWAAISGGTSSWAALAAAVGSAADSGASALAMLLPVTISVSGRPTGGAGRHVLDDTLAVKCRCAVLRHHPAQVEDRDPIGDLEHVVEVVRDNHDGEAVVTQAASMIQNHLRLDYAEGSGRLVEHHQLGIPHHRLGDGHRL